MKRKKRSLGSKKRERVRPLKTLLLSPSYPLPTALPEPLTSPPPCPILAHRAHYLKTIGVHTTDDLKTHLWSGTALHLLELTHHLTFDMTQAAEYYVTLSEAVLSTPLTHTLSRMDRDWSTYDPHRSKVRWASPRPDTEHDLSRHRVWRDLSHIMTTHSIQNTVHELVRHNNLDLTRHLLIMDHAINPLRDGLNEASIYLHQEHETRLY